MGCRPASQRGLTLLELLIVLAMVGVMSAIAMPTYNNYQRRATTSEGLGLARPAQIQLAEDVMMGRFLRAPAPPGMAYSQALPMGGFRVISQNPSAMVASVVRYETLLAVTYSTQFDPGHVNEYSLILRGQIEGTKLSWTCLAGDSAEAELGFLRMIGAPVGLAMPARWAPGGCQG